VGGYFGGRLAAAGADVVFLIRPPRAASLERQGLVVESPLGDCRIAPQLVASGEAAGAVDLVLLACKAYDLETALAAVRPAVGPATLVLPLLNGIAHLERLDAAFGRVRVLGGIAHLAATLTPSGAIRHLNTLQRMIAGPRAPGQTPVLAKLAGAMGAAGVDFVVADDIEQALWEKYVFLATLAGATCTRRASLGAILANPEGAAFLDDLLAECSAIAAAAGHPPHPAGFAPYRRQLGEAGSPLTASMLRDMERGAPTEADHILGHLVRLAESYGIATPRLHVAYAHLQAYEHTRQPKPHF